MSGQKYHHGDLVKIDDVLPDYQSHFTAGVRAIIIGSYQDQYGGTVGPNGVSYTVFLEGRGPCSWYDEEALTLIEADRASLLIVWELRLAENEARESDLDWIFGHGSEVLEGARGSTVEALGACLGMTNLWGSQGEGYVWYMNATHILELARPFLESGDKQAWLNFCEERQCDSPAG